METSIDGLLVRMDALLAPMIASNDERRHFLSVYARTTAAVRDELAHPSLGGFVDPAWAERWDLAFAELYLEALERWNEDGTAPGPWQVAFALAGSVIVSVPGAGACPASASTGTAWTTPGVGI